LWFLPLDIAGLLLYFLVNPLFFRRAQPTYFLLFKSRLSPVPRKVKDSYRFIHPPYLGSATPSEVSNCLKKGEAARKGSRKNPGLYVVNLGGASDGCKM